MVWSLRPESSGRGIVEIVGPVIAANYINSSKVLGKYWSVSGFDLVSVIRNMLPPFLEFMASALSRKNTHFLSAGF